MELRGVSALVAAAEAVAEVQDNAVIALDSALQAVFLCERAAQLFGLARLASGGPNLRFTQVLARCPALGQPAPAGRRRLRTVDGRVVVERRSPLRVEGESAGWLLILTEERAESAPEPRWRALSHLAGIGVGELSTALTFTRANEHLGALLGEAPEALIGGGLLERLPPSRRAAARARFEAVIAGQAEQVLLTEELDLEAGGPSRLLLLGAPVLDPDGRCRGLVLLLQDLTPQALAESARDRSQRELRALVDGLPVGVLVQRGGVVAHVNPALLRILGAPDPAALVGRAVSALLPGLPATAGEALPCVGLDGRERVLEIWQGAELDFDEGPGRAMVVVDATEAARLRTQLVQGERLASLGTLSAGIAHEINNPLGYVLVNLDFARNEVATRAPDLLPALDEALDGAGRIRGIVRAIRAFARGDDEKRDLVDVDEVMDAALRMVSGPLRQGITLHLQLTAPPPVEANEAHLCQVFVNLLVNAIQAVQGRPLRQITISSGRSPTGEVLVTVRDTGHGVKAEHRRLIFDPFFTTREVGEGMGLGLSVSYGIVRGLGGELSVDSEDGQGATFTVRLPAAARPAPAEEAPSRAPLRTRSSVLVIDDDERVANAIARSLQARHKAVAEYGAAAAIARLRRGEVYDLILCDLMMPGISGKGFYEVLAAELPEMAARIVFVTGGGFGSETERFLASIPNRVLDKPLDSKRLLSLFDAP